MNPSQLFDQLKEITNSGDKTIRTKLIENYKKLQKEFQELLATSKEDIDVYCFPKVFIEAFINNKNFNNLDCSINKSILMSAEESEKVFNYYQKQGKEKGHRFNYILKKEVIPDNHLVLGNKAIYRLFAEKLNLKHPIEEIVRLSRYENNRRKTNFQLFSIQAVLITRENMRKIQRDSYKIRKFYFCEYFSFKAYHDLLHYTTYKHLEEELKNQDFQIRLWKYDNPFEIFEKEVKESYKENSGIRIINGIRLDPENMNTIQQCRFHNKNTLLLIDIHVANQDFQILNKEKDRPCGLENRGQICFLNSVIQCLFHCEYLKKTIMNIEPQQYKYQTEQQLPVYKITKLFVELFRNMDKQDIAQSYGFYEVFKNYNNFQAGQQQDSQQFLSLLISNLNLGFNRNQDPQITYQNYNFVNADFKKQFLKSSPSFILELFQGVNKTIIECQTKNCKYFNNKYDEQEMLTLNFNKQWIYNPNIVYAILRTENIWEKESEGVINIQMNEKMTLRQYVQENILRLLKVDNIEDVFVYFSGNESSYQQNQIFDSTLLQLKRNFTAEKLFFRKKFNAEKNIKQPIYVFIDVKTVNTNMLNYDAKTIQVCKSWSHQQFLDLIFEIHQSKVNQQFIKDNLELYYSQNKDNKFTDNSSILNILGTQYYLCMTLWWKQLPPNFYCKISIQSEQFDALERRDVTLKEMINNLINGSHQKQDNAAKCEICNNKSVVTTITKPEATADIFVIYIQRTFFKNNQQGKIDTNLIFPTFLTLTQNQVNCYNPSVCKVEQLEQYKLDSKTYKLKGWVDHIGDSGREGHYISTCWSETHQNWFELNDESVERKQILGNDIQSKDVYLLFYEFKGN